MYLKKILNLPLRKSALGAALLSLGLVSSAVAADLSQESFNKLMDGYIADEANIEKFSGALERYFRAKQEKAAKAAEEAESKRLEDQFKNPVKIDISSSPVIGPANAKVTIVEFSDFECPFCSKGRTTVEQILKEYPKDVKVAFKHLPLPFHKRAKPAARAAVAAQRQGKFWEMHDKLFDNQQQEWDDETFMGYAKEIGLNVDKFKADYASPEVAKAVEDDAELGAKLGVGGTPGFFVNGVQVRGAQPLPVFKQIIDRWLKQS